jgi:hypothetical protein
MDGGEERCVQGLGGETCGKRDHWGDPCIDGRILGWIFRKWDVGVRIVLGWLRIQTVGAYLQMW